LTAAVLFGAAAFFLVEVQLLFRRYNVLTKHELVLKLDDLSNIWKYWQMVFFKIFFAVFSMKDIGVLHAVI
jgi:hypothetical protein